MMEMALVDTAAIGRKGGKARAKKMTEEERRESARRRCCSALGEN